MLRSHYDINESLFQSDSPEVIGSNYCLLVLHSCIVISIHIYDKFLFLINIAVLLKTENYKLSYSEIYFGTPGAYLDNLF